MIHKFGFYVVLLSGGLAWVSDYFRMPRLASLALIFFGLWVAAGGVEIAFKGEVTLINREHRRYEFFSGIPASLWSVIYIASGLGILALAWLDLSTPGGSESFFERILKSPSGWGLVMGFAGMVVTAAGIIRVLAGSASAHEKVSRLEEFSFRAGGVMTSLAGIGLLTLAAGLLFAPTLLNSVFQFFVSMVKNWLLNL